VNGTRDAFSVQGPEWPAGGGYSGSRFSVLLDEYDKWYTSRSRTANPRVAEDPALTYYSIC
jgi:hypothetical protein